MATVTDLTGSNVTQQDFTSVQVGEDSNVNVYEFGNLILADLLPLIIAWTNYLADMSGASLTLSDSSGSQLTVAEMTISNSELYDFDEYTYEQDNMTYDGVIVQGTIVDISGS